MGLFDSIFGGDSEAKSSYEPYNGQYKNWTDNLFYFLQPRAFNNPAYTGRTSAGLNQTQRSAIDTLSGYANNPTLNSYASGNYIDPATNPYVQGVAKQIKSDASDVWGKMGDQINSSYAKNGFLNSSGRYKSLSDAQDSITKDTSNALANLYNTAQQQGVANMLSANSARQAAAQAALAGGNTEYGVENTGYQQDFEAWLRQQGLQNTNIGQYLTYLSMLRNPVQTTTQESEGGLGDLLGWGIGGLAKKNKWFE